MSRILIALPFLAAAVTSAGAQETSPLEVDAGTSVVVEDTIAGYDFLDFTVDAAAGDDLAVVLAATNLATYFNVLPPRSEEATFNGSIEGDAFAGTAGAAGPYTIRVYMMRSAGRRGEESRFALAVGKPDATEAGADALVAETPFHATADTPCDAKDSDQCHAGVIRIGPSTATIFVTDAATGIRHWIDVEDGKIVSADGAANVQSSASGDTTRVTIGRVTYDIPQALVTGG